jgi:hypothetical protein
VRQWLLRPKSQDANAIRVLAGRHVDNNVLPCLGEEGGWILHDPCRLAVIAHQDHALWQPFGVADARAAAEAFRDTRLVPSLGVSRPAALVADPSTQRGGFCADSGDGYENYREHDADPDRHGRSLMPNDDGQSRSRTVPECTVDFRELRLTVYIECF